MRSYFRHRLFPLLVLAALCVASYLTVSVPVPDAVPDYALRAAPIYRLEVGAACFALLYLAAISFVLALDGRGFAELGSRGLRVEQVVRRDEDHEKNMADHMKLIRSIRKDLWEVEDTLELTANRGRVNRLAPRREEEE